MSGGSPRALTSGERIFSRLGSAVVRHPWYPILFWVILLLVAVPFLGRLGTVTTNSATTLPSSAPSALAAAEIGRLFPSQSAGSDSLLLFTGPSITGATGQAVVVNVSAAIGADSSLTYIDSVDSLYTAYQQYLQGLTGLALGALGPALAASPPLPTVVNQTATQLWGPPAAFVRTWQADVVGNPGTMPSRWNLPAYNATRAQFSTSAAALTILAAFYNGPNSTAGGFNTSLNCAANPASVVVCSDAATRLGVRPLLGSVLPPTTPPGVGTTVLAQLAVENSTDPVAQRSVVVETLAASTGLAPRWLLRVWTEFPNGTASPLAILAWTSGVAFYEPVSMYPLPIPVSIRDAFVDASDSATLVIVSFTKESGYTAPSGATPIYDDVVELNALVPTVVAAHDPGHSVSFVQTGPAALDQNENADLASSLSIVLPLTIAVLVLITMLYFRAPLVPLITFGGLGLALGLGVGGVVLLGTFITHVDTTALTLENTFVLGVGTDYSIFLVARYREELLQGATPPEAVVTSVTWAGQSIATSGATAIIATLALAFSGVALLSQWGMVLSLAVLIALLVSLTMVPALLVLVGPRIFWPSTGRRFRREAESTARRLATESTYFYRAGRLVARRPKAIVALVLVVSLPLLYVGLTSTSSYDFYAQLPAGHSATDGLTLLGEKFGAGFAFPTDVLVTFASPFLAGSTPNGTEFAIVASVTSLINSTPGVAQVGSLVGPASANLTTWESFATLPSATQAQLRALLASFVGSDGRTAWFTVYSSTGGLTTASVKVLNSLRSSLTAYQSSHPEIRSVAFGGGAAETSDIQAATALATERMAILVSIGLILVLFAVLRSWIIPLLAVATIGVSIGWAWGITNLVFADALGLPLFYFVPTVLFILILGLGIDYNIFLLTRVREERLRGLSAVEATVQGVARTGGIITAAAVILASAFAILITGNFTLLRAIGFAVATAIVLDAVVVRTYLVPGSLVLLKERVWTGFPGRRRAPPKAPAA